MSYRGSLLTKQDILRNRSIKRKIPTLTKHCKRCGERILTKRVGREFCNGCTNSGKQDPTPRIQMGILSNDPLPEIQEAEQPPVYAKGYGMPIGIPRPRTLEKE